VPYASRSIEFSNLFDPKISIKLDQIRTGDFKSSIQLKLFGNILSNFELFDRILLIFSILSGTQGDLASEGQGGTATDKINNQQSISMNEHPALHRQCTDDAPSMQAG
jgi:hypothetical protein